MSCFACKSSNTELILDLGEMPIANNFLTSPTEYEDVYPLRLCLCVDCNLVQLDYALKRDKIFNNDYPYFSGVSSIWQKHCREYAYEVTSKLNLDSKSLVVEIASNDGTLLKWFQMFGIKTIGIEPTPGPANFAKSNGLQIIQNYFDSNTACEIVRLFGKAQLIIANNVYAHLSELSDFTSGIKKLLDSEGVASIEVAYLMDLVLQGAFDTVYHEHFSYFSLTFALNFFRKYGLRVYDVERLKIHGGSIRLWLCHEDSCIKDQPVVNSLLREESKLELGKANSLKRLQTIAENKRKIARSFIKEKSQSGKKVIGFGAPAKGNTFLNFCEFNSTDFAYLVDGSQYKQGRFSPGSRIPVFPKNKLEFEPPDIIVLLPWNLTDELIFEIQRNLKNEVEVVSFFPQLSTFLIQP